MAQPKQQRESLEDVAKREAREEAERQKAAQDWVTNTERVAKEVPERFFILAKQLRECVHRFNSAALPGRRLVWNESAAVATKEQNLNADFNVSFGRKDAEFMLLLSAMSRSGRPDVYIITGEGTVRDVRFSIRIEGRVDGKGVVYRITQDYEPIECPIDELAERVVMTVVKQDVSQLTG